MDWTYRLRLRQVEILLSLARTRNISHSAKELHMTQPAVSKWLKELEGDIGLPLFERHARGLRPTVYGERLTEFSVRIANEFDRTRDEMAALRDGSSGRAVIGASGAAISNIVPPAVGSLLASMPNANVDIVEGPMDRLVHQLMQREIDIAIGRPSSKYNDADVASETLYAEQLVFAVRHAHPLARRKSLTWDDMLTHRWVIWTKDIPVRDLLESALAEAGHAIPTGSIQSNSLTATFELLLASDVVAVISQRSVRQHEQRRVLKHLPFRLGMRSDVRMYWRKDAAMSLTVGAALAAIREVSRSDQPLP